MDMSHKHEWLFKTVHAEYTELRENCITWIGLVFLEYIEQVYKIKLEADEALVLTDTSLSQQLTGIGYGINLPHLPACKVIHYYYEGLVDAVLKGTADESVVTQVIREFFRDFIEYSKVFIRTPNTFIKVKHNDLVCSKPAAGTIASLKGLRKVSA